MKAKRCLRAILVLCFLGAGPAVIAGTVKSVNIKRGTVVIAVNKSERSLCKLGGDVTFETDADSFDGEVARVAGSSVTILLVEKSAAAYLQAGQRVTFVDDTGDPGTAEVQEEQSTRSRSDAMESSTRVRGQKQIGAALQIGSVAGGFYGSGLRGIYALSENLETSVFFLTSSNPDFYDAEDIAYTATGDADLGIVVAQAKYFLGNSFFLGGGIGYRTISLVAEANFKREAVTAKITGDADSIVLDFAIGNQWSFASGLFLDVTWLSYTQPISSSARSSLSLSGDSELVTAVQEDVEKLNKELNNSTKELGDLSSLNLIIFGVGYRF